MKRILGLFIWTCIILSSSFLSQAQHKTYHFKSAKDMVWGSRLAYVYAIPNDEVKAYVFQNKKINPQIKWLQSPHAKIPINKLDSFLNVNQTPIGYYIMVYANQNKVYYQIRRKEGIRTTLFQMHNKSFVEVKDNNGKILNDAKIVYQGKSLLFDTIMQAFPIRIKKNKSLQIQYGNDIVYYNSYADIKDEHQFFRGPSKNHYRSSSHYGNTFKGYLVTNKPKYLPLDTLKFKAYLLDNNTNEPIEEPMDVFINQYGRSMFIQSILPQAKGVYFNEFVLGDSILPNKDYTLELRGKNSYINFSQKFLVEDYLLDDTHLQVNGEDWQKYQRDDSVHLYAYAHNTNGLPLIDATLEAWATPLHLSFKDDNPSTFVPDTLWHKKVNVDMIDETYLGFSTKDFPQIDSMNFIVNIRLRNANNEIKETSKIFIFLDRPAYINISENGNEINASLIRNKQSVSGKGFYFCDGKFVDSITYPISIKVNYTHKQFAFFTTNDTGGITSMLPYIVQNDKFNIQESYQNDTAYFKVNNPQNNRIRLALFSGNQFLNYTYTQNDTLIKVHSKNGRTITLLANYNWKNQNVNKKAQAFRLNNKMNINIRKSDIVFPGQKDSIQIQLTDVDQKGIANTNVTVLAFNSSFKEDFVQQLYSNGYIKPGLNTLKKRKYISLKYGSNFNNNFELDSSWLKLLDLDTNFFYKNIYNSKDTFLVYSFDVKDTSQSQIAFFIKENGQYVKPEFVKLGEQIAYINIATLGTNFNALRSNGNSNYAQIRTQKQLYYIFNIDAPKGTKTNIFMDGDKVIETQKHYNSKMFVTKRNMPDSLLNGERRIIDNALLYYKNEFTASFFVQQDQNIFTPFVKNFNLKNQIEFVNNSNQITYSIGPIVKSKPIYFLQQQNVATWLNLENDFTYSLRPNMTRMIENTLPIDKKFNHKIQIQSIVPNMNAWTQKPFDPDTVSFKSDSFFVFSMQNKINYALKDTGTLIYTNTESNVSLLLPKGYQIQNLIFIPKNSNHNILINRQIIAKSAHFLLDTGTYNIIVFWSDSAYTTVENINVKAGGRNIIQIPESKQPINYNHLPSLIQPFYQKVLPIDSYLVAQDGTSKIWGLVQDEYGPVPGAIVRLKGTNIGIVTDDDGRFVLDNPINNKFIVVQSFGVEAKEVYITDKKFYPIYLKSSSNELYESVVVYGQKIDRRSYTGALNTVSSKEIANRPITSVGAALDGSAPGLLVSSGNGQPGSNPDIMLRGQGSLSASSSPLIILDGAPYSGSLSSIDPNDIVEMVVLKDATAKAVYGARAAGGVIEIDTKAGEKNKRGSKNNVFLNSDKAQDFIAGFMENMQAASGIRTDFRDWAIWEPNLWTDKNGKTQFEAQYPGTTTNWKTYVLAMNPNGFSASSLYYTKSFKPLSATLATPRFLRYGDSVEVVGNVLNYTKASFDVTTTFKSLDYEKKSELNSVKSGKTEHTSIIAPINNVTDTFELPVSYALLTETGYEDGEQRDIPVYPIGVLEKKGIFAVLKNDTTFSSQPDTLNGRFTGNTYISVEGSLLDVMMQEVENLKAYPHGCTEQITSKLLSIHYEEKVKQLMQRSDFNNTKTKRQIINKIAAAQNKDGSFGWFSANNVDPRVTNYVISTLYKINEDDFITPITIKGFNYLKMHLNDMDTINRIVSLGTLSAGKQKLNYENEVGIFNFNALSIYNQFALLKIKKEQKLPYKMELDTLLKKANINPKGISWGTDSYDWYRNEIATTLLVYQLIQNDTNYIDFKNKIIDFLLLQRSKGYYRNTAESGLILSTLLPEILENQKNITSRQLKATVKISGSYQNTITEFPQRIKIQNKEVQLNVSKQGVSPAYVAINYEYFNTTPKAHVGTFAVSSSFLNNKDTITEALKHGENFTLIVKVEAKKNADYVLIDIPIPAGTIPLHTKTTNPYEASRANFKDKTSIYCNYLPEGTHYFKVELQARFKGRFTVNPASASMMYYPDEYGNNSVEKVYIK